ncbi:hypothetical protein F2P56_022235 [Juglans regia]|uniref:7-deoxyloganetin glucosyltransferase-like n=1 Tax=Juglans regia TaxID=51240 RepID=A0A833TZ86_JUGRE|nr:hypothetical protein F2P56_022235 [Juglans regia]
MDFVVAKKPHAVCVPYPKQGHVIPMMNLAKLLRSKGFHITFVNTEFNHTRLIRSIGPDHVKGPLDFQFETIPDGMPPTDLDATQDGRALCESTRKNCAVPFKELVIRLNSAWPPVSCIVSDGMMGFGSHFLRNSKRIADTLAPVGGLAWRSVFSLSTIYLFHFCVSLHGAASAGTELLSRKDQEIKSGTKREGLVSRERPKLR